MSPSISYNERLSGDAAFNINIHELCLTEEKSTKFALCFLKLLSILGMFLTHNSLSQALWYVSYTCWYFTHAVVVHMWMPLQFEINQPQRQPPDRHYHSFRASKSGDRRS